MPSPVGHALGGIALGWLVDGRAPFLPSQTAVARLPEAPRSIAWRSTLRAVLLHPQTLTWAILGVLPDLDLLFGIHSRQSHSVGAVAVVFLIAASLGGWNPRMGLAWAAAYGSHLLLDWLGNDTTAPIGIMLLWPFTDAFYQSDLLLFDPISRRYWLPGFWSHNLTALARELAILVPVVAVVAWGMGRRRRVTSDSRGPAPA